MSAASSTNAAGAASVTQTLPKPTDEGLVLRLRSQPAAVPTAEQERPRVTWASSVIDNEHMGRLKSNCCCIYTKPRRWDDPTTWEQDENETEHCRGHTLPPPPNKNDKSKDEEPARQPAGGGGHCCEHC